MFTSFSGRHVFLMDSEAERDLWAVDVKKYTGNLELIVDEMKQLNNHQNEDIYLAQYEKDKQSTPLAAVQRNSTNIQTFTICSTFSSLARLSSQELSQILATKQAVDESAFPGIRIHDESVAEDGPFPGVRMLSDSNSASEKKEKEKKKDKEKKTPRSSKFSKGLSLLSRLKAGMFFFFLNESLFSVLHRASVGIQNMSTSGTSLTKFCKFSIFTLSTV